MRERTAEDVDDSANVGDRPAATRDRWRDLVTGVLRKSGLAVEPGDAPERLLATTTDDGLIIEPLYDTPGAIPGLPGLAPFTRGGRPHGQALTGWDVRQSTADPDPAAAREAVRTDLENGATSVWLLAGDRGVPIDGIGTALTDVDLDAAPVVLDAGTDTERAATELLRAHDAHGTPAAQVRGNLGFDPLATAARSGDTTDLAARVADAARHAARLGAPHPRLHTMVADATPYHDAGASPAQELAAAVATGIVYLRALADADRERSGTPDLARAAARLEFRLSAGADQFLTIATLRAARAMWNRVGEVCGLPEPDRAMRQHAVTSAAMMTRRDPYVNVLRTTVACVAAGVGGADAVTVRPFDHALGLPDATARRLARNTQSILLAEAGLARVIDPAGGSGYVERLTADLVTAAWTVLQRVEAAGGMAAALESGLLTRLVDATWSARRERLARRTDPVTGVSEFPDLDEPRLDRAPTPPIPAAAGLPPRRHAQDFEALRDRSDAHLAATGTRPRVFLATLGPLARHTARAGFATHLLAAGGIAAIRPGPLAGPDECAAAFTDAATPVACLCADDATYTEHGAATVAALRAAGATRVLLAGDAETHAAAGADTHLSAGEDVVALITDLHDVLGVGATHTGATKGTP